MGNPAPLAAILGSFARRDKTKMVTGLLRPLPGAPPAPTGQLRTKGNGRSAPKFQSRGARIAKFGLLFVLH
jgi:hypothetical protein